MNTTDVETGFVRPTTWAERTGMTVRPAGSPTPIKRQFWRRDGDL